VLILVNGSPRPVTFTIPQVGKPCSWHTEIDSSDLAADITTPDTAGATGPAGAPGTVRTGPPAGPAHIGAGDHLTVRQRSLVLLLAPQSGTSATKAPAGPQRARKDKLGDR
jgi:hypothetical protein